jgi:hypothetical protein
MAPPSRLVVVGHEVVPFEGGFEKRRFTIDGLGTPDAEVSRFAFRWEYPAEIELLIVLNGYEISTVRLGAMIVYPNDFGRDDPRFDCNYPAELVEGERFILLGNGLRIEPICMLNIETCPREVEPIEDLPPPKTRRSGLPGPKEET